MKATCAVVQLNLGDNVEENVEHCAQGVLEAGREGAKIVCLPELATSQYFCYTMDRRFMELAETIPGPATDVVAAAAKEADAWVVLPVYEKGEDGQLYNSAAVIDRAGEVVGRYRKNVIPLMSFDGVEGDEKFYFRPGNLGYPVFETDLGITIGITICYERHFPEGPRSLALAGADVIFVPTATPAGRELWEIELRGMAIANLLWVAGVNRVGNDRGEAVSDMAFYGESLFSAPDGEVVSRAQTDGDEIVYAEIDTERSRRLREDWGFFRDRRPEIYGAITAP
ncbi:MAG TPA: nitrilase-related carbon-nitrogen hydrolase [Solirubrobacterales bacterium]|jgi:N-carbamoylputrescine amidase|nr:nitrilase-related carbon-nitrogen hydrolase [Solirubrobacterales bacterium]